MSDETRPSACDVAVLQARVRRLHARDDRLRHVALSEAVVAGVSTAMPSRVGGGCVATEV